MLLDHDKSVIKVYVMEPQVYGRLDDVESLERRGILISQGH